MATAFGPEGNCIIHMLAEIEPRVRIFNLDTGYQFAETLELREQIKARYGIAVEMVQPDMTVREYEEEHGGPLHGHRPDQCCHDRKILPLRRCTWLATTHGSAAHPQRMLADQRPRLGLRWCSGTPSSTW